MIDGERLTSTLNPNGYVYEKNALKVAQGVVARGEDPQTHGQKYDGSFPKPAKVEYCIPDPQPAPNYSCMGEAGARPKKVDVNLLHNEPHFDGTIAYDDPHVFDLSSSKGSLPHVPCPVEQDHMHPDYNHTPIERVRLLNAIDLAERLKATTKVDVNLSDPAAEGHYAAEQCHQRRSCPYPSGTKDRDLWLEAFNNYDGVIR